jgi:hypothetical protein
VSDQTKSMLPASTDPVQVLKNTRRTLLQLVANIDAVLATLKEPAGKR